MITINLYADWIVALRDELSSYGYDVSSMTNESVAHTFFNLQNRLIQPIKRSVLRSKEFVCPEALKEGLGILEKKIVGGQDVHPHLSRGLKNPAYNDQLLNHWGIHHLHLGTQVETDGFIKRTGPVLFARFDSSNAYFITIAEHGAWAMQDYVRTIHGNWPDSISQYRYAGHVSLAVDISDQSVAELRKANINTSVQVEPGIVYGSIGGGSSGSGLGINVVMQADRARNRLYKMEKAVIEKIDVIREHALRDGITIPPEPAFSLHIADGQVYAAEKNSHYLVGLGPF